MREGGGGGVPNEVKKIVENPHVGKENPALEKKYEKVLHPPPHNCNGASLTRRFYKLH